MKYNKKSKKSFWESVKDAFDDDTFMRFLVIDSLFDFFDDLFN